MRRKKNWNQDRHGCKTCVYRARGDKNDHRCDYILIMEHSRGCSVEDCNRYSEDTYIGHRRKKDGI